MEPESQFPVLTGGGIRLDGIVPRDVDAVEAAHRDPDFQRFVVQASGREHQFAQDLVLRLVPQGWRDGHSTTWAIRAGTKPDGELAGVVGLSRRHQEIGYWLRPEFRGQGLIQAAIPQVISWAQHSNFLDVTILRWLSVAGNTASARCARRAGFRFLGSGPPMTLRVGYEAPDSWLAQYEPDPDARPDAWESWGPVLEPPSRPPSSR